MDEHRRTPRPIAKCPDIFAKLQIRLITFFTLLLSFLFHSRKQPPTHPHGNKECNTNRVQNIRPLLLRQYTRYERCYRTARTPDRCNKR